MNIKLTINNLDHTGNGISKIDNKVIFIPNTLPNEEVIVSITKDKKSYYEGKVTNYIKKSPLRINPLCPYYNLCGGCQYGHINIDEEEKIKTNIVKEIISKYAHLDINPIFINSKNEYNYRNKVELKINNYKWGYYNNNSHTFVNINNCLLAKKSINNIINNQNIFHIKNGEIIIRSNYNDEIIIKINTNDKYQIDLDTLTKNNKIIGLIINDKIIYGEDFYYERIGGYLFKVNINSFFQINLNILKEIFNILREDNYGHVVDLYCGVGTLGISIQKDKLYGIEIVHSAIKDAIKNSTLNNQNNYYLLGDSSKIKEIKDKIDTIIIDPPRSGLNKETLDNIININPAKIIYMSCNPITLARDLYSFKDLYNVKDFYILNMFPKTKHIECLCILNRK